MVPTKFQEDTNMNTIDLEVKGMHCGACVKRVTQALQALAGVSAVEVDLPSGHVRASGEFAQGGVPAIEALAAAGYAAQLASSPADVTPPGASTQAPGAGRQGCGCGCG
jgi:copper chaperone CopZ